MNLSNKDRKLLWGKASNCCSYRFDGSSCCQALVVDAGGKDTVVGEECHIVGEKPASARYSQDYPNRETYENAILLCPVHHKMVDDNPGTYTVPILLDMKSEHESSAANAKAGGRLDLVDCEFKAEVTDSDRAVGMEVTRPASLSGVKAILKASNVREAIGFSTNQGLTAKISSCPHCGALVPSAYTGPTPAAGVQCKVCGKTTPP